ncbi:heterokaryon incompatibility protein-domain-containing protein [Xylariales sp. PMI_506]|nr:heterokaryon incompatibility protein-domain-containing protein [Xylariales sp. PMI_506]
MSSLSTLWRRTLEKLKDQSRPIYNYEDDEARHLFPDFVPCRYTYHAERWGEIWYENPQKPRATSFDYDPLLSPRSIRLIHLQPGKDSDPVSCRLVTVDIDAAPTYEAISYVWGETYSKVDIVLNGATVTVTANLGAALARMRLETADRVLWADAVCINQNDLAERSAQVQMMRTIYERAHCVLIWLERKNPDDEDALRFIDRIASENSTDELTRETDLQAIANSVPLSSLPPDSDASWRLLFNFFELDYFCRTWIIQEVQANAKTVAVCGDVEVNYLAIELAALWAFRTSDKIRDKMITDRGISNVTYIRRLAAPNLSLMNRLEQARGFFASDARDKVFAFLRPEDSLVADYTRSIKDVYLQAARQILREDGFDGLSHVAAGSMWREAADFPTWVPTFSQSYIVPLCKIRGFTAGGSSDLQQYIIDYDKLKTKAIFVDRIVTVHPSLMWNNLSLSASQRDISRLPTYVDRLWYLYGGNDKGNDQLYPNQKPGGYSRRAAFAMALTAGLGRWGLPRNVEQHETAFSEYTEKLFKAAAKQEFRLQRERWSFDGPVRSNAWDMVGDMVGEIKAAGGSEATQEPECSFDGSSMADLEMRAHHFQKAAQSVCNNRCVFQTRDGYLGLGPAHMGPTYGCMWDEAKGMYPEKTLTENGKPDEVYEVWAILGAKVLYILQPHGASYRLVGECYLQGFMEGEVVQSKMNRAKDIKIK